MKILITGATGAVGPGVVHALHNAQHSLRVLAQPNSPYPAFDDIEIQWGDVTDANAVHRAMIGVDAVVHMAALLHIVNPPPSLRGDYERVNVGGTRNVVDAGILAGVGRIVLFSTIAVYGPGSPQVLNEDSPLLPDTFYAQTKVAAEQIVLAAKRGDGQAAGTVLRLAAVYGARIKGNYERLVRALEKGRFVPVGRGSNHRTLIHEQDVALAAALAVAHPAAAGRVYNVSDGRMHTMNEIIAAICAALGRPPPRWSVPADPVRTAAGLVEDTAHLLKRSSPIGRATIDKYTEEIMVDARRIQTELGFQPRFDLAQGWEQALAARRKASPRS